MKAHKSVICSRSEMFKLFLSSDISLESQEHSINIENCSKEAFEAFLEFLYIGKLSQKPSTETLKELYVLGDKYCDEETKYYASKLLEK